MAVTLERGCEMKVNVEWHDGLHKGQSRSLAINAYRSSPNPTRAQAA